MTTTTKATPTSPTFGTSVIRNQFKALKQVTQYTKSAREKLSVKEHLQLMEKACVGVSPKISGVDYKKMLIDSSKVDNSVFENNVE
eukprot:7370974-Ditylum_brightwellii.AAC.1